MRAVTFAIIALLLAGCVKPDGERPAGIAQDGELTGEVFIVTAGAQSIKLGLVTVVAIPEGEINNFIEQKKESAAKLLKTQEPVLQAAVNAVADSQKAITAAENANRMAASGAGNLYLKCLETSDTGRECRAVAQQFQREKQQNVGARKKELGALQAKLAKQLADRDYLETSDYYFTGLPAGIASAKTNADGLFTMKVPRDGRFALAARASRQVFGETEQYFWLVWASLDGEAGKRILLSNDNLTTVASPDSVITLPR